MALTVEDGSVVQGAESYCSVTESDEIANDILINSNEWTSLSSADKELYLKRATRILDLKNNWNSEIKDSEQALGWPRKSFKDSAGRTVPDDVVPQLVKEATVFVAHNESQKGSMFEDEPAIKQESYGDSSVTYATTQGQSNGEAGFFLRVLRSKGYASSTSVVSVYRS